MTVVRFINVIAAGLVAGAMAVELTVLIPVLRASPQQTLVDLLEAIGPRAARSFPLPGILATVAGAVVVFEHDLGDTATILTIAGLALWIAGVLVTLLLYFPIAARMSAWSGEVGREERESVERGWASVHAARTALFICGFGLFVAAAFAA
jgi:cell division protein FtsW (lipid II flippase)